MAIKIDKAALDLACREIIESILFCIPKAYKGTVYRIGKPPGLIAKRITSGIIDKKREAISWGLPEKSDYNPPGKPWMEYRDEPGRPSEAMAWCVERQKSWTGDPQNDSRSVRLQVEGKREDFYHMEPVLILKRDLYLDNETGLEAPGNYENESIWQDSEYAVVAVIKIHFLPNTIKMNSPETRIITKLSRALGTEFLSYQLRYKSLETMRQLAEDKLNSCNILADAIRNVITKSGLIFSLIKLEMGFLRRQWEDLVLCKSDQKGMKQEAVNALNKILNTMDKTSGSLSKDLIRFQNKFLTLSLPPKRGENWVRMQIEERWNNLLCANQVDGKQKKDIFHHIERLKKSLSLGKDTDIIASYDSVPEPLKMEWVDLIYMNIDRVDFKFLEKLIHVLQNPSLNLRFKRKSSKSLIHLKALAEIIAQLEEHTNIVLRQVLNGNDDGMISDVLDQNKEIIISKYH